MYGPSALPMSRKMLVQARRVDDAGAVDDQRGGGDQTEDLVLDRGAASARSRTPRAGCPRSSSRGGWRRASSGAAATRRARWPPPRESASPAARAASPASSANSPKTVGPEPLTSACSATSRHGVERLVDRRAQRARGVLEVVVTSPGGSGPAASACLDLASPRRRGLRPRAAARGGRPRRRRRASRARCGDGHDHEHPVPARVGQRRTSSPAPGHERRAGVEQGRDVGPELGRELPEQRVVRAPRPARGGEAQRRGGVARAAAHPRRHRDALVDRQAPVAVPAPPPRGRQRAHGPAGSRPSTPSQMTSSRASRGLEPSSSASGAAG